MVDVTNPELLQRLERLEQQNEQILRLLRGQQPEDGRSKALYTTKEAAELTDYSEWTLRQACNTGRIKASKGPDDRWRISREGLEQLRTLGLPPLK